MTREEIRLQQSSDKSAHWKRWGPYVSERAWGTVREDYSTNGTAWEYLTHDQARSKAYRWNEDGLAGLCDRHQNICFAMVALVPVQAEQTLFQDGVLAIPQRDGEADILVAVTQACEAVFVPAVSL